MNADHARSIDPSNAAPDSQAVDDVTVNQTPPPLARLNRPSRETASDNAGGSSRYRLIALHASGGMGRVWIAEDQVMKRRVAVKELRPDLNGSDDIHARFLQEIHVTARLEHPGIVPIYDFAQRPDGGPPIYVMRFIEGNTLAEEIHAYHEARRGGPADRLKFVRLLNAVVAICQTVGFAHSRSVLHRDLKPANILLGAFGEVLVLDWGLVKLMSGEHVAAPHPAVPTPTGHSTGTQSATVAGQVLGTPAYMAPEQASGQLDRLDARTDVFGLGAILYEVLTGAAPFAGMPLGETTRRQGPARPREANPQTAPALEAICLQALAAEPEARYPTAAALADDVQRWLADEPVSAYPERWWQRAGRWTRRHRGLVASVLVLALSGFAALATTTVLVNRQRQRAEASLQTALDAVDSFLVKISEERLLYEPGMQPLRTELLRTARTFGEKFVAESEGDPGRRRDLARMLMLLGKSAAMSGEGKQALADLNRSRDLYRELQQRHADDPAVRAGLARCQLETGIVSRQLGLNETKIELLAAADLLRQEPDSVLNLRYLALAEYELGLFFINTRAWAEARPHLDQAIAVGERALTLDPDNWIHQSNLAASHSGLAEWFKDQGKLNEAKAQLRTALALRERLLTKKLLNPLIEDGVAQSHNNLGNMSLRDKDLVQAERHFLAAFKHYRHLANQSPAVPRYRRLLGVAHYNVSRVIWLNKKPAQAVGEMDKCVAILEALHEDFPETPNAYELAQAYLNLAYYQREIGMEPDALQALKRAEETAKVLPSDATLGTRARLLLRDVVWTRAQIQATQRRFAESLQAYHEALAWDDGSAAKDLRAERDAVAKLAGK